MRKLLVLAIRDYLAAVRTKSFILSLVLMPMLMGGSILIQLVVKKLDDTTEKRFAIVDRTPGQRIFETLEAAAQRRNATDIIDPETGKQDKPVFVLERIEPSSDSADAIGQQRYQLSQQTLSGEYYGFLEIGADVYKYSSERTADSAAVPGLEFLGSSAAAEKLPDPLRLRYQSKNPQNSVFSRWAERTINEAVQEQRWAGAGLSRDKIQAIQQHVPLVTKGLSKRSVESGEIEDAATEGQMVNFLVPVALCVLMFMMLMIGATPLIASTLEEKMGCIAEVLLGSVRPFQMMLGKLLGMAGVSLTIAAVYLIGIYATAYRYGYADLLSVSLLLWFLVFLTLALLMYGSIFVAIGAACTDWKETQTMVMPIVLLACLPMFILVHIGQEPNSLFSTLFSLFPPVTPMVMLTRQAVPPGIPWWQPVLGVILVLAFTMLCVYAAGRIFRVGILMQGKGARFGDLFRWVVHG